MTTSIQSGEFRLADSASPKGVRKPRVAIACSGLGHIRRGNETWAQGVAEALAAQGEDVTLLGGGGLVGARCAYTHMLNLPRQTPVLRNCLPWHRRYLLEQLTATASLLRYLKSNPYDIIHVPDPDMALQLHKRARGGVQVIFKDGQFLGPHFCSRFRYVQALAPYYRDLAGKEGFDTSRWFVIPHLVNVQDFKPPASREAVRRELFGDTVDPKGLVVLAIGDFSPASHKRLDWIVQEFARFAQDAPAWLVLAGQSEAAEFARFSREAKAVLGDRVRLYSNLPAREVAKLYQAADIFAHAALREPFGIVFLEAMASGLPAIGHRFPVTEWIVGDAGCTVDMQQPGALSGVLRSWSKDAALLRGLAANARNRAVQTFAEEEVVRLYVEMYQRIVAQRDSQ